MTEGLIAFGGSLFGNVFGLLGNKIDTQTGQDVNRYNQGQSELKTRQTQEMVTAAVAAAIALLAAIVIVKIVKRNKK